MGCRFTKLGESSDTIDCIGGTKGETVAEHEAKLISAYLEARTLMPELRCSSHCGTPKLKKSVRRNKDLVVLAAECLKSAADAVRLLSALKPSLSHARDWQVILSQALECFGKEVVNHGRTTTDSDEYYSLTLAKLKEFVRDVPAGSPFVVDFASLLKQQRSINEKLAAAKEETRKRLRSLKIWKKVFKVLWNAAFLLVIVLWVGLAVVGAPACATVAASAGCTAIKAAEQWLDAVWDAGSKVLKGQKDAVAAMMEGEIGAHGLETVQARVMKLEINIASVLRLVKFAVERGAEEGVAVEVALEEMMRSKVLGEIKRGIDEVEVSTDACVGEIQKMVALLMNAITID